MNRACWYFIGIHFGFFAIAHGLLLGLLVVLNGGILGMTHFFLAMFVPFLVALVIFSTIFLFLRVHLEKKRLMQWNTSIMLSISILIWVMTCHVTWSANLAFIMIGVAYVVAIPIMSVTTLIVLRMASLYSGYATVCASRYPILKHVHPAVRATLWIMLSVSLLILILFSFSVPVNAFN